jgi:hypothetical protein
MEHFFTPTRRLQIRHDNIFAGYTEVQLAVSIEEFMSHRWDWSAFYAFATDDEGEIWKLLWITENTFICVEGEYTAVDDQLENSAILRATFTAPSGETYDVVLAVDKESASLSAGASRIFWHAVTTSNCVKLRLDHWFSGCIGLCSGPALSQFLEASPSLKLLEFVRFYFEDAHCRALATLERTGLKVAFNRCSIEAQGAKDTFIEWLRHSQVVTKLEFCTMESSIISALNGNSSVKSLSIVATHDEYGDSNIRSLALALPGNQGIENLRVSLLSDETWSLLLRSLWAHPRIRSVSLTFFPRLMPAASRTSMMNAVLRLVQCNTVMHTIDLPNDANDEEFFQNFVLPRLEMNRSCFEDQRQALTRADPSIRGQLLGRALYVVRSNPDLLFRFLSENVPAFVRSDEDGPILRSGQKRKARP